MKKVEILNTITGQEYGIQIEDPTDWIAECIANNSWGKPARECRKTDPYEEVLWLEDFEKEIVAEYERDIYSLDGEGNILQEEYTYEDPNTGEFRTGMRNIILGSEIVPAVKEVWVRLRAEYDDPEIVDITEEHELKLKLERKIQIGASIQGLSDTLIQLITGDNMESGRTAEEIAQMQVDFADINALISAGRLITAKPMIEAIDNELYTELKADILALYALNGF